MNQNTIIKISPGEKIPPVQKRSLTVLPETISLREPSPFLESLPWPDSQQAPRALRGLSRIVDGGLCHRCGSCIGICPTGVLDCDELDYPHVANLSACTDCDLCVKVCPGDEFNFAKTHESIFPDVKSNPTSTHGHFIKAAIAHAADKMLRKNSTSGGLITELLLFMLDEDLIDGAVVVGSDEETIWKGKPIVARTREEILSAVKSKYAISPTNTAFGELLNTPGRYALVGLPCQIHGFHKAAALDTRLKERVVLTIGLLCHAAIEHEAFEIIWDSLPEEKRQKAKRFISRVGKHPGTPHLELDDGGLYPVYFGDKEGFRPSSMEMINILYRLYTPARCLTCFDATSEFADIAVGDPWMTPPDRDTDFFKGWSFALIRSEAAERVYEDMLKAGRIVSKPLSRNEALQCNHAMSSEKRWRAFRIIEAHRRQGRPVPLYGLDDFEIPGESGLQFLKTEANLMTHSFCFFPRVRPYILKMMLSNFGYALLWLNNKRRRVKFFLRDSLVRFKRQLAGKGSK